MKKMLFLLNPNAGQKKASRFLPEILSVFQEGGYEVTVFLTTGPGSGTQIVEPRVGEYDLIVCAGGDGTLNETVSGVLQSGIDRPVGYIPCGSTNDFAATLKLSVDVVQAARDIVEGTDQYYDLGIFNGRHFCYVASFGAFTRVSYTTPQNLKNALGHMAYLLSGIQELAQIRKIPMSLELDGELVEGEYIFGAISNATTVGGVINLSSRYVDLHDGKFEVMLVRMPRDVVEVGACVQAMQTQEYNCAPITFRSVSSVTIRQAADVDWTLDGERAEGAEVIHIENLNRAFCLRHRQEQL